MSRTAQTLAALRQMKLNGMADAYDEQLNDPSSGKLTLDERLGVMLDREVSSRQTRKVSRLINAAKFPEQAALEGIDYRASRELDRSLIASLSGCDWIVRRLNIILLGAAGTGKTWIGTALATQGCRMGFSARYYQIWQLGEEIALAVADGTLPLLKKRLVKLDVLYLDDFALGDPMDAPIARELLDIVDRRQHSGSLILTSQQPTAKWQGAIADRSIADAVLDRIVHKAHRIELKGDSLRKIVGKRRLSASGTT